MSVSFLISAIKPDLFKSLPFELTPRKSSASSACATELSCLGIDASHIFSRSFKVASGLDFLGGMVAAAEGLAGDASGLLLGAGEAVFVDVAGELSSFGAGDAVFSVVTDTLGSEGEGSDFSGGVISGETDGLGLDSSSWAPANGAAAMRRAVRTRMVVFIFLFLGGLLITTATPRAFSSQAGRCAAERPPSGVLGQRRPYFGVGRPVKTVINRSSPPQAAPWPQLCS